MAARWDFYNRLLGEVIEQVQFNLDVKKLAPIKSLPWCVRITILKQLLSSRDTQLTHPDEEYDLLELEYSIIDYLKPRTPFLHVATIDTKDHRRFVFYTNTSEHTEGLVEEVREPYVAVNKIECEPMLDARWSVYESEIFPNASQQRWMTNRHTVERLAQLGDPLTLEREIDHMACFRTSSRRKMFVEDASEYGFQVRDLRQVHNLDSLYPFIAQIWRVDRAELASIHPVTCTLERLASQHDGRYEGWEAEVLDEKSLQQRSAVQG